MNSYIEKLNLLAAGLMTAVGAHVLLCLASLPSAFKRPHDELGAVFLKAVIVLWLLTGVIAGAFVVLQSSGIMNARSYRQARTAAVGSMVLPLLGSPGIATAFALVPLGIFTLWLLKQPVWKALFEGGETPESVKVLTEIDAEEFAAPMETADEEIKVAQRSSNRRLLC